MNGLFNTSSSNRDHVKKEITRITHDMHHLFVSHFNKYSQELSVLLVTLINKGDIY